MTAGSLVTLAAAAICIWNLFDGLRSGRMHFGVGVISADAERTSDSKGFWFYAALNAASLAVALVGFMRSTHYG
ncbi:MAG: hypothetical protein JWP73_2191 [Phenylobacterium sp.]|nr:hypothetical protein [Phenylobacterium sp.]